MAQASRPIRPSATTSRTAVALSGEDAEEAEEGVVESLKWEIARLEALVSELRATSPSVARLADLAVWREREAFEEKTRRALVLLRRKDSKIRALGEVAAKRKLKIDARSAVGRGSDGGGGGRGGGGDGGGGRGGDGGEDESSVVVRLEQCVQEREGQIDVLLEEVKRLRSAQSARPVAAAGADGRDTAQASMNGLVSVQPPTEGADFFMQSDSPRERPEVAQTGGAFAPQENQAEWRESLAAVDDLRAKIAKLESALSSQAVALAQKDSALGQASACHQRELEDSQEREARLGERVETLERLQETARRTVLDREERLRQLEDGGNAPNNTQTSANESNVESRTGPAACSTRSGEGESKALQDACAGERQLGGTTRGIEKSLEDFIGAQEWWLHLAAAVKRREGHLKSREGEDAASRNGGGRGGVEGKKETRGLRRLLGEQGLEIVALRQRVLKADVDARAKAREGEQRATEDKMQRATAESSLKTQKLTENVRVAELEKHVAALSVQGAVGAALAAAREEVSALKLAVIRAEGDAKLHAQLLDEEKVRSVAALSRAEDLQGELDKLAVEQTLRGVPGGVSASTLIDHFAGTLVRQSHRVEGLEAKVRGMRTRCARLACLARGDPVDVCPDTVTHRVDGTTSEGEKCEEHNDEWAEAGVQEAAVAMEAGRRRALEEEVESLRQDVLNERRRADAGQRDATDELRRRSLAHPANGSHDDVDAATLRRKLILASSEIEALRTNTKDLRRQIQSGYWLWQARGTGADEHGGGGKKDFSDGSSDAREAASMLKKVRITAIDCGEGGGDEASASAEVARLSSLLAEKSAQVSVLTSTVEALHAPTSFVLSPAKDGDGGTAGNADPRVEAVRDKHGESGGFSEPRAESAADVDGGVGILNHIGAQGLARHCVALAVRLTSTAARAGAAERRVDRLAAEMEVRERKMRAAAVVESDLSRRNRALQKVMRKTAEALSGMRAESSARLQEAGEEASQLRSALRDAELGADDAQQRLASARAEGNALAAELQTSRERYRDDVARLSKEHDTRIKECADRLFVGASPSQLHGPSLGGERGAIRKTTLVSPVVSAIAELAAQWCTWVATEDEKRRHRRRSTAAAKARRRPEDKADGGLGDGGSYEQQLLVTAFLRETATRLDAECSCAVRHARALEWELRGARQEALDATITLEEVRTEAARLSARAAVAEAAVAAASFAIAPPSRKYSSLPADPASSSLPDSSGGVRFGFSVTGGGSGDGGGGRGEVCRGMYTVAAVSLLEKRLAAALEDLVSSRAARLAAEAGESAATARAEAAETEATGARAAADVLSDELERHKSSVSNRMVEEAAGWRREMRSELGRWWQDDLMSLHNGVVLDWGSAGAADEAAAVWNTRNGATPTTTPLSRGGSFSDDRYAKEDPVNVGISGKGAMAQALIAGRAEQAALEERVRVGDHRLAQVRGEALHLRAILERWHGDFVVPAMHIRRRKSEETGARKGAAEGKELLERKLLAVTAELLGVRDEAAGLRGEIVALQGLVARLREDENEARETAGRRVESARGTVRRRAEGDLRDASERLVEERQTFKSQLGAAHADILRLGAEIAELERQNRELVLTRTEEGPLDWRNSPEGTPGGRRSAESSARGMVGSGQSSAGVQQCLGDEEGVSGEAKREQALRMEVEEEREALRRMCNGLAVDLKAAVEARADAEDDREALVQEAVKADAQAKIAGLARENQETALKDLGRLLEVAREAATEDTLSRRGEGDRPLNAAALSAWDYPKEEAQRFARFMVAAKVMQADLLRRLQVAGASEADLRHVLRRRDIRIEELKREQAMADRLATSNDGMPRSTLVDSLAGTMNSRQTSYAVGAIGGALAADTGMAGSAAERAAKEVALAATVKRLELELAEAAARGDVGDAAVRTAERLALRLFPEAAGGYGEGGRNRECHLCGRHLKPERRDTSLVGSHARGSSFLMPSTVVERKAAAAGGGADHPQRVKAAAQTMHTPTAVCDSATGGDNFDPAGVESDGGNLAAQGLSFEANANHDHGQSSTSVHAEDGGKAEHGNTNVPVVSQGLSTGLQSIEVHLARLEAVASCGFTDGTDAADSRVRSSSPGGKSDAIEWALAQVVHDLRTQVAGLRDQAEVTAELLNAERAGKDDLEAETLRLRAELLRQQRSYWRATATLKNRYERALHEEGTHKHPPSTTTGSRQTMLAIENIENRELRGSVDSAAAELSGEGEPTPRGTRDTTDATGSSGEGMKPTGVEELQVRLLEESLRDVRDQLRSREQELRDGRALHGKAAREAKVELDRAIEAQQARVGTLENQLRRVRKKVKAMARPKPTRVYGRGMYRERVAGGGSDDVAVEGSPLSIDELLNMLAAADEEVFEAKGRTQRLEHELRAKTAEAKALLESETTVPEDETVGATANDCAGGQSSAVDSCVTALSPTAAACFGASAFSVVACAARLACSEAEVGRLRDEGLAASEVAIVAQREASSLRLAAHRRTVDRAGKGRSREKELRRQLSAYKREVNRLRLVDVRVGAFLGAARDHRPHRGGEAAVGEDTEDVLSKTRAQLDVIREESERRGRAIATLRATKTSLGEDLDRRRQEAAELEAKLVRALTDLGVKSSAVKALRGKISSLEADIENAQKAGTAPMTGPACTGAAEGAAVTVDSGDVAREGPTRSDAAASNMRELRAECDRLRASMRSRQGSLSKQAAEIEAQARELEKLEAEAGGLRAAVARKDDAYRSTKKKLASVREELESFKESSGRWKADAEAKWRQLKRASESVANEAKTCRQAGDAAERELATLKAAFRSFLRTLWDDMRHRPSTSATFSSAKPLPARKDTNAEGRLDPSRLVPSGTGDGIAMSRAGASAPLSVPMGFVVVKAKDGERGIDGAVDAGHGAKTNGGPFAELTEAELSDIMLALSGDSYSQPVSDRVAAPSVPPDLLDSAPVTQMLPRLKGAAPTSPPLDREFEEEEAFSARIESALEGQNTSAALADMLRSLHAHNVSEVAAGAGDSGPLVPPQPPPPPPNVQSDSLTTWAEPRSGVPQAPGPSDADVGLEGWPHARTPDHAASGGLLGSGDGGGDRDSGVLLRPAVRNTPSLSALDGAAALDETGVLTFGGNNHTDSLLVEDLM